MPFVLLLLLLLFLFRILKNREVLVVQALGLSYVSLQELNILGAIRTENGSNEILPKMLSVSTGLNRTGLFRISGSAIKIHALKSKFDQGEEVDLVKEGDVDSIASLLKLFLNELPDAIFPESLCSTFFASSEGLLNSLPKAHYSLFHFLVRFLVKVASFSDVNHMTLENLAIVFGPTLFR
uniref:Rho-GAP domain-containing protein n=1 Tax=Salvator merianae TaxID=96440 RepID=A0A8D0DSG0_SALMN